MNNIKMLLKDKNDNVLMEKSDKDEVFLDYRHPYALGDYFEIKGKKGLFLDVQMDASMSNALIYCPEGKWIYKIPFNIQRESPYPQSAFLGDIHYAKVKIVNENELNIYRNVAENSHDQHDLCVMTYPHATANAETRGESVFFAKNAIDGILANRSHGNYPYQSWGINQQDNAELMVDFGREVETNKLGIVLRADYPHDSYWTDVTVEFSDETSQKIKLKKTAEKQLFEFNKKRITWIKLTNLIKDKDMSTFPALTQLEVYGK